MFQLGSTFHVMGILTGRSDDIERIWKTHIRAKVSLPAQGSHQDQQNRMQQEELCGPRFISRVVRHLRRPHRG